MTTNQGKFAKNQNLTRGYASMFRNIDVPFGFLFKTAYSASKIELSVGYQHICKCYITEIGWIKSKSTIEQNLFQNI